MERIAILGLGLMGASIAQALRARGYQGTLVGYARRPETINRALEGRFIDEGTDDPAAAVQGADLVVLCIPVAAMRPLTETFLPGLAAGSLVTDVGSTKAGLVRELSDVLRESPAEFVGSHPIAGSEQQGLEAASPHLYEGAVVVVTPETDTSPEALQALSAFWTSLGSRVVTMDPADHDRVLGRTSHLPHVVASALSLAVGQDAGLENAGRFCGTGFESTTRIAEGSPTVWRDILDANREPVLEALRDLEGHLAELRGLLESGQAEALEAWLTRALTARKALIRERLNAPEDA